MLCLITVVCFVFVICCEFFNTKIESTCKPKVKRIIKRTDIFVSFLLYINNFFGTFFSIAICMFESTLQGTFAEKANILNDIVYPALSDIKYNSFIDNATFVPILRLCRIQMSDKCSISFIIIVSLVVFVTTFLIENTYATDRIDTKKENNA